MGDKRVNSTFILTRFLDGIEMAFYLDGGEEEDEKVIFGPKTMDFQGLGIKEGISFDISYELSDSNRIELVLCLGVDFDGDKRKMLLSNLPLLLSKTKLLPQENKGCPL